MDRFRLSTPFTPKGDQPAAIAELTRNLQAGERHQVLLGVTGSGKTFTVANVIQNLNRPTLVIAHNKTLAAQLYGEFMELFPDNAVEFFVSYYDYYQPEAYLPTSDTYIEKDAMVNDDIDRLRHSATRALLERRDVIIVASVSCIFGIGSPKDYMDMHFIIETGARLKRDEMLRKLVKMQYERSDIELKRGTFRVRGDTVEVYPSFALNKCIRIEFFGDDIDRLTEFDPLTGQKLMIHERYPLFPNSHWITPRERLDASLGAIEQEARERAAFFMEQGLPVEAQRIEQRTMFDLEMLREFGYCHGIENYSRYLSGREPGAPPYTLIDFFPDDLLIVLDESHATVPQIRGMYNGDRARKENLIKYGFRLPSALDNRPLRFDEFEQKVHQAIYASATPADYELQQTEGTIVEQIIRPTGLIDPKMLVRPVSGQVDDILEEIRVRAAQNERILITALTKKSAEDLTEYYTDLGIRARYLHSDIDTLERVEIIRDLRTGAFDVLVGVNLLREGLDLPEVSLVAILDADKEGFLRSERSIIQTAGRAARNINGTVILYADRITGSMERAIRETERRRKIQTDYNHKMGIIPESIKSSIKDILSSIYESDHRTVISAAGEQQEAYKMDSGAIVQLEQEMKEAASKLEFEKAARLRDRLKSIKAAMLQGMLDAGEQTRTPQWKKRKKSKHSAS